MRFCIAPPCAGLASAAALFALAAPARAQASPNVVLIVADDLGYGDLGPYDHDEDPLTPDVTNTPVLDQMALDGARLTSFYATAPVCTPTRAALLTGRYQVRSGLTGVLFPNDPAGLPQSEVTLAELCRARGYRTQIVGKWHLGDQPQFHPLLQGFDAFYGVPYSNDMEPFYTLRDHVVDSTSPDQTFLTQQFFAEARASIAAAAAASEPFFLYLPLTMPHVPVYVSPTFDGATGRGLYADCLREIDAGVGDVLADLAALGIDDDTLVVFTSDNGPWDDTHFPPPWHPEPWRWVGGRTGGLRGSKATFFEGGVRVPCVMRWTGTIAPETTSDEPVSCLDLFRTLVRATGGAVPTDRKVDGRELQPLLSATAGLAPRDLFFCASFTSNDSQFGTCRVRAMRSGRWKVHFNPLLEPTSIFDLALDPGETTPLDLPELRALLQDRARGFQCTLDDGPDVGTTPAANLALGRPTLASSSIGCDSSRAAVDGAPSTHWSSAACGQEWLEVDLEHVVDARRIALRWGGEFATSYVVEGSLDAAHWSPLADVTNGDGGLDVLDVAAHVAHVRITCRQGSSALRYELAELRVFQFESRGNASAASHVATQ